MRHAGVAHIRGFEYIFYLLLHGSDEMMPPSSSGLGLRPLTAPTPVQIRWGYEFFGKPNEHAKLGCGVIGNTADSGSAILGSSPGIPANEPPLSVEFFVLSAACEQG